MTGHRTNHETTILKNMKPKSICPRTGSPRISTRGDLLNITIGDETMPCLAMKEEETTASRRGAEVNLAESRTIKKL